MSEVDGFNTRRDEQTETDPYDGENSSEKLSRERVEPNGHKKRTAFDDLTTIPPWLRKAS